MAAELKEKGSQPLTLPPDANTIPKNFLHSVRELGGKIAMRKKRFGVWQEYTWNDSYQHIHDFCLGLVSLGLKRKDTVAIIGENDPEFYWAEIAVHSAGGSTTAIFTDANLQELEYIVNNSDSVFLLAHDQEQCDKALDLRDKLPKIRKVVYWDDKGLWNYDDPWLASFEEIEALGREYAREHPGIFEKLVGEGDPEDVAILSYTSGTSGLPKGAMISHRNLLYSNLYYMQVERQYPTDNYVSFSPLAWITEQTLGLTAHVVQGFQVNFPEGPETMETDLREISPSHLLFPSRVWENLVSIIQVRINDSSPINRLMYKLFMPVAYKIIDMEDAGDAIGPHWRLLRWMGEFAIFQPLRDKIGMVHMRNAHTSGAILSPSQLRFLRAIGVQLKNLYGSTECQLHTFHQEGDIKLASVGTPPPGIEIRIAENGEILIRSKAVFSGYYKSPEQTAEAIDEDGWFHTGDAGYIDKDDHLIYLDRVSDMVELAGGESFSPQFTESQLKFSPYIQDIMTIGGFDMEFVSAIVIIDFETIARWAEKNHISFTTFVDLSQKPEVYDIVRADVEKVNESLPPAAQVKKFVILHKAFDADEAELTRTRKLRRRVLHNKYGDILEAMYGERDKITVSAEVKYRDGRTGVVETALNICTI